MGRQTSPNSTPAGMPLNATASLGRLVNVHLHFNSNADLQTALAANTTDPLWPDGSHFTISGETGTRRFDLAGNHVRNVDLLTGKRLVLVSSTNVVTSVTGTPTGGNPNDVAVNYSAGVYWTNTLGTWAQTGTILPSTAVRTDSVKTINGQSLLGSGDIAVPSGSAPAPTASSIVVNNATPSSVEFNFSVPMYQGSIPAVSALAMTKNGNAWVANSFAWSSTTKAIATMASALAYGDSAIAAFTEGTGPRLLSLTGNMPVASFTAMGVTNNVFAPSVTAPTIASQPVSQTVAAGATATFTVVAIANGGTLAYQWQSKASGGSAFVNVAGATAASYTTPATGTGDTGTTFDCVISNAAGSVTSSTVTLTVTRAPVTVPSGATLVTALYPQDPDLALSGNDWGSAAGGSPPQAFSSGSSIGIMAGDGFVETIYTDASSGAYIIIKAVGADYNSSTNRAAFIYFDSTTVFSGVNGNDNSSTIALGDHVRLRRAGAVFYTEKQVGGAGAWVLLYTFPAAVTGTVRVDLGTTFDGVKKARSVAAYGVSPITVSNISSIAAVPGKAPIGINWASYTSGDRPNVFVDMCKQGGFIQQPGTGNAITSFDSNGWPTVDFRMQAHLLDDSTVSQDCAFEIGGWADSIAMELNHGRMSILNKVYDSVNNKTNFTVRVAAGSHEPDASLISFTGTRRTGGSTGTVNTGLSYVKGAHPGYALSDIGVKKYTDEYLAWMRTFKAIRFMDALNINNDLTSTAWSAPGPTPVGTSLDDMIDLCNAAGCDMWICFLYAYTDAAVASMAAYIDSRLSAGLHFYWEYSNETWNSGFRAFHLALQAAATEVKGFIGLSQVVQEGSRNVVWSRSGNVVTLTTGQFDSTGALLSATAHGWSAGKPIYIPDTSALGGSGTSGTPTLLTASGNTATITSPGPDTGTTLPGTGFRVSYDLTGTLAAWDSLNDLYGLKSRWCIRRAKQMSDAIRGALGDAKMQTRCRAVWADQMGGGGDPSVFDYVGGTFTSRVVSQYFYGWAGAPYYMPNTTATDNNATEAAVVADLNAAAASMKYGCAFDSRVMGAGKYGLRALCYEGGPDTTSIYHGEGSSDNSNAALVRNQAMLDPAMKTGVEAMLSDWFKADGDLMCWYSGLFIGPTDNNRYQCWAVTDTVSDFTAGKMAAFKELGTNGVPVSRNVLSGTVGVLTSIDGRLSENLYDTTTTNPPPSGNSRRFFVYTPVAGIYDVSTIYSAAYGYSAYLQANNDPGQYFGTLTVNPGAYPDYSASHETPVKQVYLHAGSNCINLYAGENHGGGDVMWRTVKLTRVS